MKKLIARAALLLLAPVFATAQDADHQYHGQGYMFFAGAESSPCFATGGSNSCSSLERAGSTTALQFGGGGEFLVDKGLGFGGELLSSTQSWEGATLETWIGSINASYHFGSSTKKRKLEPFVTGGYTFLYVSNTGFPHANGGNFGVGVNMWLTRHAALRLEIRDDIGGRDLSAEFEPEGTYYLRSSQHLLGFRIGVTFR
jgi:hypothetical protein